MRSSREVLFPFSSFVAPLYLSPTMAGKACRIWVGANDVARRYDCSEIVGDDEAEWEAERRYVAVGQREEENLGTRKVHAWGSGMSGISGISGMRTACGVDIWPMRGL